MRPFAAPPFLPRLAAVAAAAALCAACASGPSREEQEAAKNTLACASGGERIVIRFDAGEARLLLPDGERVALYQIPAASGVRYSNGRLELRGKGMDLTLSRDGTPVPLAECRPYQPPPG